MQPEERRLVRIRIGDEELTLSWSDWEDRVRAGRVPEDATVRIGAITGDAYVAAGTLEVYRSIRNDAALAWQGRFLGGPPPLLTAALVGVQIRIWWTTWIPGVAQRYVRDFTNFAPAALEDGEAWRLITMGFLHVETFHVFMNLLWLAYTGWNLERALGRVQLAVLYLASVVGGSVCSMWGSPETPSLGASGGVFGLVSASVVFGFTRPAMLPERARAVFGPALAPYLALMFWSGLQNEGTDNWCHFGGLVVGGLLALVLDPPLLERRPGWNRVWQGSTIACLIGILLAVGTLGPRLHPTPDAEVVRTSALRRKGAATPLAAVPGLERPLSWRAPGGWRSGVTAAGDPGLVSPAGPRAWSVQLKEERAPTNPRSMLDAWLEKLRRGWPDAIVGEAEPIEFLGRPGLASRVEIASREGPRIVEWRGTTRGVYGVQEVWEVDAVAEGRLAPLRDRLRASTTWGDPEDLIVARRDVTSLPNSRKHRGAYADALLRVGEMHEALAIRITLLEETPRDPDAWKGLLRITQWYPEAEGVEAWWTRALAESPTPQIVTEVALALEAAGRYDEALGLIDLSWAQHPGDRILRRARTHRQMPTMLTEDHQPWDQVWDPVADAPRTEVDPIGRPVEPLTLAAAAARAVALRAEREAVVAAIASALREGRPDAARRLLLLRHGGPPEDLDASVEALRADLERTQQGTPPGWIPDALVEPLRAHPVSLAETAIERIRVPSSTR